MNESNSIIAFFEDVDFIVSSWIRNLYPRCQQDMHKGITFFLQSPVYLSTYDYMTELIESIVEVADKFKPNKIFFREHPDFKIGDKLGAIFCKYNNVINASSWELSNLFAHTKVAVSHFSSCLIESYIHGCIPVSYDPTYGSRYSPDLESEGLGFIAKSRQDLMNCIVKALSVCRSADVCSKWAVSFGSDTINNVNKVLSIL